jgi:hypothetical protein
VTGNQLGDAGATCATAGGDTGTAGEKDKCCSDALKVPALFQGGKCLPMS